MTVKELMEALRECNPDEIVLLSSDPEGNGYRRVSGLEASSYQTDDNYRFECGIRELTPDEEAEGYTDEDVYEQKCVTIWPR